MEETGPDRIQSTALQSLAVVLLIGQSPMIQFFLIRAFVHTRDYGLLAPIVIPGVTTLASGFYFYRFILRRQECRRRLTLSYISLKLWRVGLVPVASGVAVIWPLPLITLGAVCRHRPRTTSLFWGDFGGRPSSFS